MKKIESDYKFTVIIKTFNCEDSICNTLESIKEADEIIIIDEHSSDDTVEIAKEYKAKIIYATKNELLPSFEQALQEASNEWILIVEENEVIPQRLFYDLEKYIENPKKNKYSVCISQKLFYFNKELKSARNKNALRFFKKGYCEFKNHFSMQLKLKKGKIHKINTGFKTNAVILKYLEPDITKNIQKILEKNKNTAKIIPQKKPSIILIPLIKFIYFYFFKGAIFDGINGFIYAKMKYFEDFTIQTILYEKSINDKEV